ncbi:MAG: hypothetical protein JWO31_2225 [Phycisphaerales bacterium]|nr:hypothetical protein [Phycisphaerales bacterium]
MATFAYTAINRSGKRTNGTLSADTRAAAIAQVTRQGLHPVKVNEQAGGRGAAAAVVAPPPKAAPARPAPPRPGAANGKTAVPAKAAAAKSAAKPQPARPAATSSLSGLFSSAANPDKVKPKLVEGFTRDLANLLAGGVSLARSLSLLKREASNPSAKALWTAVHDDVVGGTALADAMAKYPKAFTSVYVAMVRAGEQGGFLDVVLQQITDFRTREADLKGKVKAAMIYPVILGVFATGVVVFLLTWFIPRFSGIFKEFGDNLPTITVFVIGVSNVCRDYGLYVLAALVAGAFGFKRLSGTDVGRRQIERVTLAAPVLGRVVAHFALVRFCRMLGTLVGSGVPLIASLRTAREAIGNQTLSDTVSNAIDEVQRGEALSESLRASPRLFPASVVETLAVSEETGRLDKELLRLAASYEADLDRQLRMLVAITEPLLLFVMASIIGTIVVGMLLPVFNMSQIIK